MDYWQRMKELASTEPVIIPGAAGAIVQDGKILLVRHNLLKKWQIPGGIQEPGESIHETVKREIKEELGLSLAVQDLVGVYSGSEWVIEYSDGHKVQQLLFFFLLEGHVGEIKLQESEVAAYRFFALDEIPEDTMECCKQKVVDLMRFNGKTIFR
jgi:8-oxo-dGTP pyrophosphatase MutT (NUDIX family)